MAPNDNRKSTIVLLLYSRRREDAKEMLSRGREGREEVIISSTYINSWRRRTRFVRGDINSCYISPSIVSHPRRNRYDMRLGFRLEESLKKVNIQEMDVPFYPFNSTSRTAWVDRSIIVV